MSNHRMTCFGRIKPLRATGIAAAIGLLSSACSVAPSAEVAPKNPLEIAMAREATATLAPYTLVSEDGTITANVKAASTPELTASEGFHHIAVPIGTGTPVQCFVYAQRMDLATSLQAMAKQALATLTVKAYTDFDAGVMHGAPYMSMSPIYVMEQAGRRVGGLLKMVAVGNLDSTLLCVHDEVGYRASFKEAVAAIAEGFSIEIDEPTFGTPTHHTIAVQEMNGRRLGFSEILTYLEGESRVTFTLSGMAVPRSATDVVVMDVATFATSTADGIVRDVSFTLSTDGEVTTELDYERKKEGLYSVSGTLSGKQVDTTFPTQGDLMDIVRGAEMARTTVLEKGETLAYDTLMPMSNPLAATRGILAPLDGADDNHEVLFKLGPLPITGTLDDTGLMVEGAYKMGPTAVTVRQVHRAGALR